jgi:excinuclease ABC subunit A
LQPAALAVRIEGRNIAEFSRLTIAEARDFCTNLSGELSADERQVARTLLEQIQSRLGYLAEVGLDYLTLDRGLRTLSGGEGQRVALTAALGTRLVNTLYVLDEPSIGLHPRDTARLLGTMQRLRDLRNTVVVVEHDPTFLLQADEVIDIGPGAGAEGGRLVFQGSPAELALAPESVTGAYLSGRKRIPVPTAENRRAAAGQLRLEGVRHHNLQNLTVEFPLGLLCVVTGVSGSGKSSLVPEVLYPALCQALGQTCTQADVGKFDRLSGAEQVSEVLLVDQSPIGRSPRSNPVTYLKAFDAIRKTFAETPEAQLRNFKPGSFSFNSKRGGRCPTCEGNGTIGIDMQFLADVSMTCPDCHGTRFQREILEARYRGLNIAEVLALTVREAIPFFRGQSRLQRQLKSLKDVGLDYLTLGQPAHTLSGGESQRLKLATCLSRRTGTRTLFLMDEPTNGLHTADVAQLLGCFETLLETGHSLIVIEHNLDVMKCADQIIDLGPEAGDQGGRIVAQGAPEEICRVPESITGRSLADALRS